MAKYKFDKTHDKFNHKRKKNESDQLNGCQILDALDVCVTAGDGEGVRFPLDGCERIENFFATLKKNGWVEDYKIDYSTDGELFDNGWQSIAVGCAIYNGDQPMLCCYHWQAKVWDFWGRDEDYDWYFTVVDYDDPDCVDEEATQLEKQFFRNDKSLKEWKKYAKSLDVLDEKISDQLREFQNECWDRQELGNRLMVGFVRYLKENELIKECDADFNVHCELYGEPWACDSVAWIRKDGGIGLWSSQRHNVSFADSEEELD